MKQTYLSTAMTAFMLSLASLTLPPVGNLHAADIFTKVTTGPGSDVGYGFGVAWGDYDNDGFIDLFVPQSTPGNGSASHFLYHNNTNGTFSRVTNGPVAAVVSAGRGAAWGDYDNDGYLDLVLVNFNQPNYLFHNNGDGSFAAVPNAAVVSDLADSYGVTWVDYDNDGYLDLFRAAGTGPRRLYHNNHDGTLTRITQGTFLTVPGFFTGVAWGDYNNDGRPDLFLPQDKEPSGQPSYLYRNDGGGTFTRVAAGIVDGNFNSSVAAWGDYDNDGDLDLFVSCNIAGSVGASRPNLFYRNDGNDTFTILTSLPANDPENQGGASVGCNWGDYDNDGYLDLFVANRAGQNDFLYHNNGDGTFTKVLGSIAVNDGGDTRAAAWGDYDNDGFLDLFVESVAGTNFLYHNNTNDNHWLKFRLIGTLSNRAAIGAKVRVRATINGQSFWQMREVSGGDGRTGQNSLHVHVGLGNATNADLVRIEWPSGTVQELSNVASKQFLTMTEPARLQALGAGVLRIQSWQGMAFEVQSSTNLDQWSPLTTVTNLTGTLEFTDPNVANDLRRFYRTVIR